jgi:hypothetical protein
LAKEFFGMSAVVVGVAVVAARDAERGDCGDERAVKGKERGNFIVVGWSELQCLCLIIRICLVTRLEV